MFGRLTVTSTCTLFKTMFGRLTVTSTCTVTKCSMLGVSLSQRKAPMAMSLKSFLWWSAATFASHIAGLETLGREGRGATPGVRTQSCSQTHGALWPTLQVLFPVWTSHLRLTLRTPPAKGGENLKRGPRHAGQHGFSLALCNRRRREHDTVAQLQTPVLAHNCSRLAHNRPCKRTHLKSDDALSLCWVSEVVCGRPHVLIDCPLTSCHRLYSV